MTTGAHHAFVDDAEERRRRDPGTLPENPWDSDDFPLSISPRYNWPILPTGSKKGVDVALEVIDIVRSYQPYVDHER